MSFQSLGNLEKNAKRILSILCPFNKNCDVTSRTSTYLIFKSNVVSDVSGQNQIKFSTPMKQDERSSKI